MTATHFDWTRISPRLAPRWLKWILGLTPVAAVLAFGACVWIQRHAASPSFLLFMLQSALMGLMVLFALIIRRYVKVSAVLLAAVFAFCAGSAASFAFARPTSSIAATCPRCVVGWYLGEDPFMSEFGADDSTTLFCAENRDTLVDQRHAFAAKMALMPPFSNGSNIVEVNNVQQNTQFATDGDSAIESMDLVMTRSTTVSDSTTVDTGVWSFTLTRGEADQGKVWQICRVSPPPLLAV